MKNLQNKSASRGVMPANKIDKIDKDTIKIRVKMYGINVTFSNTPNTSMIYTLPVYLQKTKEEKADQYATYYSRHSRHSSDSKKNVYDNYYNNYISNLSDHDENNDVYEKEKKDYIYSYLIKKIKESCVDIVISNQIAIQYSHDEMTDIDVSVSITPIIHLNLSCVDVSEYFYESLQKHQPISHANYKIVWVNKDSESDEWELFTCVMSTATKYKITISNSKNRNDFFSKLTDLARQRLEYLEKNKIYLIT